MSGIPGERFRRIALRPGLQTGRYSKHLKRQFPKGGPYYRAQIPIYSKRDPSTKSRDVIFKNVYHSVAKEVLSSPNMMEMLKHGDGDNDDSVMSLPAYKSNRLVQRSLDETGSYPLPLGLYTDGIRYTPVSAGRVDLHG
eukprot:2700431-Pyramimonas_sp.AAC.2